MIGELNTGILIADVFEERKLVVWRSCVLCKTTGPLMGNDAFNAVHNAVLEEVAKMAAQCEWIRETAEPAPQCLQTNII